MFTECLFAFMAATLISFAGSLQPGPVNMGVIYISYSYNLKSAVRMALGGALPEIIYSSIAMIVSLQLTSYTWVSEILRSLTVPVLIVIGCYLIFKKQQQVQTQQVSGKNHLISGFVLGMLNPMLLPFWAITINYLQANHWIIFDYTSEKAAFVLGTSAGAFLLLWPVAIFTEKHKKTLYKLFSSYANKISGSICIILALIECVNLVIK